MAQGLGGGFGDHRSLPPAIDGSRPWQITMKSTAGHGESKWQGRLQGRLRGGAGCREGQDTLQVTLYG